MVALNENEKQVIELFRQLPPERRRVVILEMTRSAADGWKRHREFATEQLKLRARERGLDWDQMSEGQRQDFVTDLLDENGQ
jgi:hypothetical protein